MFLKKESNPPPLKKNKQKTKDENYEKELKLLRIIGKSSTSNSGSEPLAKNLTNLVLR